MVRLGDVPDQHVHHAAVFRETRGDLLGEEAVRPVAQAQAAGDGVVVGERYQGHPTRLAQLVLPDGVGVAFGTTEEPRVPLIVHDRGVGMNVQVATTDRVTKTHGGLKLSFSRCGKQIFRARNAAAGHSKSRRSVPGQLTRPCGDTHAEPQMGGEFPPARLL